MCARHSGASAARRLPATLVLLAVWGAPAARADGQDSAGPVERWTADEVAATEAAPRPGFAKRLVLDLGDLVSKPARMVPGDWTNLVEAGLAIGATRVLDTRIRAWVQDHRSPPKDDFAKTVRPIGRWGAVAALGVTWVAGKAWHEPGLVATAEDGLEATIISAGLLTPALKEAIGRARPSENQGSASFSPFSGQGSFPSGDETLACAVASVVSTHTESPWISGAVWGLAGLVGWERLTLDQHWASDLVAGALIGTAVGHWVAHHQPVPAARVAWVLQPSVGPRALGFQILARW